MKTSLIAQISITLFLSSLPISVKAKPLMLIAQNETISGRFSAKEVYEHVKVDGSGTTVLDIDSIDLGTLEADKEIFKNQRNSDRLKRRVIDKKTLLDKRVHYDRIRTSPYYRLPPESDVTDSLNYHLPQKQISSKKKIQLKADTNTTLPLNGINPSADQLLAPAKNTEIKNRAGKQSKRLKLSPNIVREKINTEPAWKAEYAQFSLTGVDKYECCMRARRSTAWEAEKKCTRNGNIVLGYGAVTFDPTTPSTETIGKCHVLAEKSAYNRWIYTCTVRSIAKCAQAPSHTTTE